jgi:hypothetical protein
MWIKKSQPSDHHDSLPLMVLAAKAAYHIRICNIFSVKISKVGDHSMEPNQ